MKDRFLASLFVLMMGSVTLAQGIAFGPPAYPPQPYGPPYYFPPGYVPPNYFPPAYAPPMYVPPVYPPPFYMPRPYMPPAYAPPVYGAPGYGPPVYMPPGFAPQPAYTTGPSATPPAVVPSPAIPRAVVAEVATADVPPSDVTHPFGAQPSGGRFWMGLEVLFWSMKPMNLPPLITASPAGTPPGEIGVPGAPGTTVLFGGSPVNGGITAGGRISAGYWFDCDQTCGVESYFFQLGNRSQHGGAGTPGNVGRPFFNTATGRPDAELVSAPGVLDGGVRANASSGSLLGAGILGRANLCCGCRYRLDALFGYRFLSLIDDVNVQENLTSTDPAQTTLPVGTNILLNDSFHTTNQFNGADIGLAGEYRWNSWILTGSARLALGATHQRVDINGATAITVPGFSPVVSPGGLLALPSNIGTHSRDVFGVVPELRFGLGYQLSPHTRIHAGYTFLYWNNVARAGDQIDLAVNPALLPPTTPGAVPQRPAFNFQSTGFWAQGVDLGLEFRF